MSAPLILLLWLLVFFLMLVLKNKRKLFLRFLLLLNWFRTSSLFFGLLSSWSFSVLKPHEMIHLLLYRENGLFFLLRPWIDRRLNLRLEFFLFVVIIHIGFFLLLGHIGGYFRFYCEKVLFGFQYIIFEISTDLVSYIF